LAMLFDVVLLFFVLDRYHHLINRVRYYWFYVRLLVAVKKGQQLSLPV
jgi:hypothetical protein